VSDIGKLLDIMARLRDPSSGCPWDIVQTFDSVAPYTIEEAYEVADAAQRGNYDDLCEELGDLLLNVVFHSQMAKEASHFTFSDVVDSICDKMVRRHPHVFADTRHASASDALSAWETQKAAERSARDSDATVSALAGVAKTLPALMRAQKLGKRASRVGFDWKSIDAVFDKIREELVECEQAIEQSRLRTEEELGDLLFAVVNLARHTDLDAEVALRKANEKFQRRFEVVETGARDDGCELTQCSADELDVYWRTAKRQI
jgi:ATP diphosphatase